MLLQNSGGISSLRAGKRLVTVFMMALLVSPFASASLEEVL